VNTTTIFDYPEGRDYESSIHDYERAIYRLHVAREYGFDVTRLKANHFALFIDLKSHWDYEDVADHLELKLDTADAAMIRAGNALRNRLIKSAIMHPDAARERVIDFSLMIGEQAQRRLRKGATR
jgi:hypothetical protein